jgi:hypothetical protein
MISSNHTINEANTKMMMDKFNALNEQYNKQACGIYSPDSKLNMDEEDVFKMINKAYYDINLINTDIENFKNLLEKYNNFDKECEEVSKTIQNLYDLQKKIVTNDILYLLEVPAIMNNNFDEMNSYILQLRDKIKSKRYELDDKIGESHNKLTTFNRLILKCIKTDDKKNYKNICTICITNRIDTCLNTCGHTFCSECISRMGTKCGMCRNHITSKIKLFMNEYEDDNCNNENETQSGIQSYGFGFNANVFAPINPVQAPVSDLSYNSQY